MMQKPQPKNQYILFIDESGKSKLSDTGDRFLLSGVIIEKGLHHALSDFMISLKSKNNIPIDANIHAYDLFEKEEIKNIKLSKKGIDYFFEHFIHLVRGTEMKCILYEVDKRYLVDKIKKKARKISIAERVIFKYLQNKNQHDILYEILTAKMILQFGKFLEENDSMGKIIVESRRQDDGAVLKGFMLATEGSYYMNNKNIKNNCNSAFNRITSLSFQNKKGLSFGLELADLFAWAKWNSLNLHLKPKSLAQEKRVISKIKEVINILYDHKIKIPEKVLITSSSIVGGFRVSEFINSVEYYKIID
jgi:hypothetical protein